MLIADFVRQSTEQVRLLWKEGERFATSVGESGCYPVDKLDFVELQRRPCLFIAALRLLLAPVQLFRSLAERPSRPD